MSFDETLFTVVVVVVSKSSEARGSGAGPPAEGCGSIQPFCFTEEYEIINKC